MSSNKGFARARDGNEPGIVRALRSVGATVTLLNEKGVPDLLVGFGGSTELIEVKTVKGRTTPDQDAWVAGWRGRGVTIVRTVEHALQAIGLHVPQPGLWYHCPAHPYTCDGRAAACCDAASHRFGTYPRGAQYETLKPRARSKR